MNPELLQTLLVASTLLALWIGWIKVGLPRWRKRWRKIDGVLDTIGGRPPIVDPATGKELAPAQPALGMRMSNVEDAIVELRHVVELLTEVQRVQTDHAQRISALEVAAMERIVTKAESAHMWRAVANEGEEHEPPSDG